MLIDSTVAAAIRDVVDVEDHRATKLLNYDGITLAALIEVVCSHESLLNNEQWAAAYQALNEKFPLLRAVQVAFDSACNGKPASINRTDVPLEIHAVAKRDDFRDNRWITFQENFVRRLIAAGFQRNFSYALTGAFNELAENIPDHSASVDEGMAPGVIGYHVETGEAHFAIGDIGRGALASLQENPRWDGLENCTQALEAILWNGASRKPAYSDGGGFRQVWKSFLDRNGTLIVHSGDGYVRAAVNEAGREQVAGFTAPLKGFRVFGSCFLTGTPTEKTLKAGLTHVIT